MMSEYTTDMYILECLSRKEKAKRFQFHFSFVYIHYRFDEREHLRCVTCNIDLSDLDRTGPEHVKLIPFRLLSNDVNALPKGVNFVREFLRNAYTYIAAQHEAN